MSSQRPRSSRVFRVLFGGGAEGNERLTAATAIVLLVLLAGEGVTILAIRPLLTPHEFIGMLLIPPVALKLASTGYRFLGYYRGREPYVAKGPPQLLLRVLVAPALVAATVVLFATGVAILALHQRTGMLVGIHKASFVVWAGAFGLHVLAYLLRLPRAVAGEWRERVPGRSLRYGLLAGTLALGMLLALGTVPVADNWLDQNVPHQLDVS